MSKLLLQLGIVGGVFAVVLGCSYPVMLEANREEQLNHYPDQLVIEEGHARRRFAAAEKQPSNVDEYLTAGDELASVLVRQQRFDDASAIYQKQLSATWALAPNSYNPRYVDVNLKMAGVLRDKGIMPAALVCYKSAYDLDHKYLGPHDLKIARDLNNIGLTHYMQGLSLDKAPARAAEFQLAVDNLKQALDILNLHPESKGQKATALWNLYLAERDLGNKQAAQEFRKQAKAIDGTMNRVCKEP